MKTKKFILFIALILCAGIAGYLLGSLNSTDPGDASRRLMISAVEDDTAHAYFSAEELSERNSASVSYRNLSNVTIEIKGEDKPLEEAIKNGDVSTEELFAFARIDEANGICTLVSQANHGLTQFSFCYPEFDIIFVYDIYETPDGKQHLINTVTLCEPYGHRNTSVSYVDPESEYLFNIDREDWGIQLEVTDVSPTGITVLCTQSGGQQIGTLEVIEYQIFKKDTPGSLLGLVPGSTTEISRNGTTEFSLDWTDALESGTYTVKIWITDHYSPDDVHPLMQNYYDNQYYYIEFTI